MNAQSRRPVLWSGTASVLKEYALPSDGPDGVAYDPATNPIYIISNGGRTLHAYENVVVS